ncbi:MAG: hypothetical protein J0H73_11740 [Salana multivorans]|uniref:hypothetical protein n=1 Tax=Salana multivorans TaxID=120377 RepID=UPI000969D761|nr:hypothetical protein [Salana multivorans]MBN8882971.1 hypothetical protein [Salana multivorans]OJX94075.1 MAG: hypothetical protein BGO96_09720 [Micrococcales bacterium 73-15]
MQQEHASITVQRDMLAIVNMWPALLTRLEPGTSTDESGVRSKPASRPAADLAVSDLIADVTSWVYFLARTLHDEVTVERDGTTQPWTPATQQMPAMLDEIARWRIGHFTEHDDEMLALAIADYAAEHKRKIRNTIAPTGARRIDLRIPCLEHDTDDHGRRTPCCGSYHTTLNPGRPLGDMICNNDPTHRMTPAEWQTARRRGRLDPTAVHTLLNRVSS